MIEPPELPVRAVESGKIKRCRAVDPGGGAGNYAAWMAGKSFDITGIDISPKAIAPAEGLAALKRVKWRFAVGDVFGDMEKFYSEFDLAYDWQVRHHISADQRLRYGF